MQISNRRVGHERDWDIFVDVRLALAVPFRSNNLCTHGLFPWCQAIHSNVPKCGTSGNGSGVLGAAILRCFDVHTKSLV